MWLGNTLIYFLLFYLKKKKNKNKYKKNYVCNPIIIYIYIIYFLNHVYKPITIWNTLVDVQYPRSVQLGNVTITTLCFALI